MFPSHICLESDLKKCILTTWLKNHHSLASLVRCRNASKLYKHNYQCLKTNIWIYYFLGSWWPYFINTSFKMFHIISSNYLYQFPLPVQQSIQLSLFSRKSSVLSRSMRKFYGSRTDCCASILGQKSLTQRATQKHPIHQSGCIWAKKKGVEDGIDTNRLLEHECLLNQKPFMCLPWENKGMQ